MHSLSNQSPEGEDHSLSHLSRDEKYSQQLDLRAARVGRKREEGHKLVFNGTVTSILISLSLSGAPSLSLVF